MRTIYPLLVLFLFLYTGLEAQTTYARVYEILQDNCATCHSNADPEQGLDLEGSGADLNARMNDVYGNLVGIIPANSDAAAAGLQYIHPGRADLSFLFHKVNQGLEPTLELDPAMGAPMPFYEPPMDEVEREMIRQWILFGAPQNGTYVNEDHLDMYYSGQGLASFPEVPAAPAPGEGFQIKMGPFYLSPAGEPGDEVEYFQKYALDLPDDLDVDRIDMKLSTYSHHFIMYNYLTANAGNNIPAGLRTLSYHQNINLVAAVQEATDLKLPEGTAFQWPDDQVLDLNSHYINYSAGLVYQAEVYVNVYTKPAGTAAQRMYSELIANTDIYIPNNGNEITETQTLTSSQNNEVYLWNIMGHTHQYGTGYKVYEWADAAQGELLYDGACAEGIPGCASPFFDYQHIPPRYFEPLRPLKFHFFDGLLHEASWINDGPEPVWFGPTSDDEMMVLVLMYTLDSVGVHVATAVEEPGLTLPDVSVYPNPATDFLQVEVAGETNVLEFRLFDLTGREVYADRFSGAKTVSLDGLPGGMYTYRITADDGRYLAGKILKK